MSKENNIKPALSITETQAEKFLCASPGVDPSGRGEDFVWENCDPETNPGGSGDDFNWGN